VRYHASHQVTCDVPASQVYDLVRASSRWPALLEPCEEVRVLESGADFELIEISARVGGELMTWRSRRHFTPAAYGVDTDIIQPMKLVKAMTTTWRVVELNCQQSVLLLEHFYDLCGDVAGQVAGVETEADAVGFISRAIDANSSVELGNMKEAAERAAAGTGQRDYHLRHSVICAAPADTVYELIRYTTHWPRVIDACLSAVPAGSDGTGEIVRIDAMQEGQVVSWETRRQYFDDIRRIDYTLPVPMPFVESMSGQWRVIALGSGKSLLTVDRSWRMLADVSGIRAGISTVDEAAALVRNFVDGNASAEMAAFRAFVEDKTDHLTSVVTRVPVRAPAGEVYSALANVCAWPGILPHCESLDVTYDDGRYQEFLMRVETPAGTEAFRSVRACDPDTLSINYFQPEPPGTMRQHHGSWRVRATEGGSEVIAKHTALLNTGACESAFGTADLQEQKSRVRALLDRNSWMTAEAIARLLERSTAGATRD
jgi:ribosome-associated toxin RatA of RatAB toxin-antitoxin module